MSANSPQSHDRGNATLPNHDFGGASFAAKCLRIAEHFSAIAAEIQELEKAGELSADSLASLREREQSHVDDASSSGLRRKQMSAKGKDAIQFLAIGEIVALLNMDVRSFRRLRRDERAMFPAPHMFGTAQRWKASEVRGWIERKKARS